MSKDTILSTRIPEAVKTGLDELAKATERPVEWHVARALGDYVELSRWHVEEIKKGLAEADAGQLIPHAEVKAWVDSWDTPSELPMPKCK